MKSVFFVIQIIVSIVLTGLILIQAQGSGLGSTFGGTTDYHSKKGVEKLVFVATIVFAILFLASSLINAFLP